MADCVLYTFGLCLMGLPEIIHLSMNHIAAELRLVFVCVYIRPCWYIIIHMYPTNGPSFTMAIAHKYVGRNIRPNLC